MENWQVRRKAFFFEKKKQKTFIRCFRRWVPALNGTLPVIDKSFLVLFFKKNFSLCLLYCGEANEQFLL
jgi:hypothetical protein